MQTHCAAYRQHTGQSTHFQAIINIMSTTASTPISTAAPLTLLGVTGNTASGAVTSLLDRNDTTIYIRGIVRSDEKGTAWLQKLSQKYGADRIKKQVTFAVADQYDAQALVKAFTGSSAVYVFLVSHDFPDSTYDVTKKRIVVLIESLSQSKVNRIVALSSVGGHVDGKTGAVRQEHLLECALLAHYSSALASNTVTLTIVRAGAFFTNAQWDIPQAKATGKWASYAERNVLVPWTAPKDVGTEIAKNLIDRTDRNHTKVHNPLIVELQGPKYYSVPDFEAIYSKTFGREVKAEFVPRNEWTSRFESMGIPKGHTHCLEDMYDAFNSGLIVFEDKPENGTVRVKGTTTLEEGMGEMIQQFESQNK